MGQSVVRLHELEPEIAQITMEDRVNKNTFTNELMGALLDAFEELNKNDTYKAVILTGFDGYFCSGGSQEGLLAINQGEAKFTDGKKGVYSLPLECKIPVISAMQGHGIGGGFALGLFSDFVILSRESVYTTNFMKYGFTPGFGATFILPKKLGLGLAEEFLFRAATYRGAELEKRGIPFPVLPRNEVMSYALEVARDLAKKPRLSLITLKDHLVKELRNELDSAIDLEIEMHEKTFHSQEVKERIMTIYGK